MFTFVRAGLAAAFIALTLFPASIRMAADKAFKRGDLDDAAIKLEAQIKSDAGTVTKPAATLRREADAAFQRNDFRTGMTVLGQLVTVAPTDATNWLRLARTVLQIRPRDDREKALLLDRASTAAYIAYNRATARDLEADSLAVLGKTLADRKQWRPALDAMHLALDLRETADLRGQYERLRSEYGFRMLDYSVDSDAVSPRACFQFSEELPGRRTDFSPFVAVAGQDKPAISANDKQLCVEGLKHGERYEITLRAGLPSTVRETLSKSAQFTIFVRDRKPFVRFSGKAYVLPRTGQRGIPVLSVNTSAVVLSVYRIGDRNLLDTVLGYDFQRNLRQYEAERLANERGAKVWSGELDVTPKLNTEVATAFPVDPALGELKPGVYVMTAAPKDQIADDYGQRASQWFIVSDLGLTAYSGHDGIDVFVHSLASAEPSAAVAVKLVARNNEVLANKTTDKDGFVHFEAGLTRGEGGQAPAAVVAADKADYAFLSLKTTAFDLSDRGVAGRQVPTGLDAFVYTERGVYRSGETVHVTSLLRDARGIAAASPLTLVMERPDGVEYRRAVLADQGLGGHSWSVPIVSSASTGTWRVVAYTDPKRPPVGETTFLVEDYVADRIEFDLTSAAKVIPRGAPAQLSVDGHFLYGAPASNLDLTGAATIAAAKERPGFAGYSFGLADDEVTASRQELEDMPATDATGKASFQVKLDKIPATSRPLEATITVSMAESGGRAVERKLTLPIAPDAAMIGVKPAFAGRSLADGANADFDVVMAAPDGKLLAQSGLHYELLRVETSYQWYRQNGNWEYEPVKRTERVANGTVDTTADKPARISMPVKWGRYRLEVSTGTPNGTVTSLSFDAGFYAEASADTPDLLEVALDKSDYKSGDAMTASVTARTAGRLTLNVFTDRLVASTSQDVQAGSVRVPLTVGKDWGTGAYLVATLRRPLDAPAQRMPGRAIGVQWFSIDRSARTLALDMKLPATMRPDTALTVPIKLAGLTAGEEAHVVVAAVDVGILNLTNYKPPAPDNYYLGQRQLTAEIRDLYGQLIDGMQGVRGAIRSGGDSGAELAGSPPTQAPLALYSGIVQVGADGTAQVRFDIPAFAGTVRVMAVAWSKDKVGKASGDVIVRDPVVLTATLPRFLRTGDRGAVQLELDNVEGAAGDYQHRRRQRRRRQARRRQAVHAQARRQAARPRRGAGVGCGGGDEHGQSQRDRAERLHARTRLCAQCAAGQPDPDPPHRALAGARRNADVVEGHVRRFRAGHRPRRPVGRDLGFARHRHAVERTRPLSVRLLRADHQPRGGDALHQRAGRAGQARARRRHRPAHQGRHPAAAGAAGFERLVRPVVGRRQRSLARRLCHRLPHPRARAQIRGAAAGVQSGARPAAQLRRAHARSEQERRPRSRLCALRAGAQWRRAGRRLALHRRHQAQRTGDADRQGASGRRARHARRQGARRPRLSRRARCHSAAAQARVRPRRLRLGAAR